MDRRLPANRGHLFVALWSAQNHFGVKPSFAREALRQRWQIPVGQIKIDALDPVHREEDDRTAPAIPRPTSSAE